MGNSGLGTPYIIFITQTKQRSGIQGQIQTFSKGTGIFLTYINMSFLIPNFLGANFSILLIALYMAYGVF